MVEAQTPGDLPFAAHIDLRGGIFTDEHHGEARRSWQKGGARAHELLVEPLGEGFSVEERGAHELVLPPPDGAAAAGAAAGALAAGAAAAGAAATGAAAPLEESSALGEDGLRP